MNRLEMKKTDLGELYNLLEMYERTYGGVPGRLLEAVMAAYRQQGGEGSIRNPRGAGRKKVTTQEEILEVRELREKGYKIREIAAETGYSVGYVHKLINEQKG